MKRTGVPTRGLLCAVGLVLCLSGCAARKDLPLTNHELLEELQRQQVEVSEKRRGIILVLPSILFASKSAALVPGAHRLIASTATVLNNRRAVNRKIAVEGYADARGGTEYNLHLARRRAETVTRELMANGVDKDRIKVEEYGEQFPIAPNKNPDGTDNPAGREQNRRVEVVILK